jgi:hypothetical protein
MLFLIPLNFVKMSDCEDDDKLGDPEGDTESEKLSQSTVENPSDKPDEPRCRLRSGTASYICLNVAVFSRIFLCQA